MSEDRVVDLRLRVSFFDEFKPGDSPSSFYCWVPGCQNYTEGGALLGNHIMWPLCDDHRNMDGVRLMMTDYAADNRTSET